MSIYFVITAGDGPKECSLAVTLLSKTYQKDARAVGLDMVEHNSEEDRAKQKGQGPSPSLLMELVETKNASMAARDFLTDRIGSVQWISPSPYRPNHRRKNWFVSVQMIPDIADIPDLQQSDIDFSAMKATGPGGQHVNATQSAIRATHKPSGVSVVCRDQRSQHANKKLAIAKLALIFAGRQADSKAGQKSEIWKQHKELERGNPVRIYEGPKFKLR